MSIEHTVQSLRDRITSMNSIPVVTVRAPSAEIEEVLAELSRQTAHHLNALERLATLNFRNRELQTEIKRLKVKLARGRA